MAASDASIVLIAAPYDSGLRLRMGRGPDWLLEHGLAERLVEEGYAGESVILGVDDVYPAELEVGFFLHRAIAEAATNARSRRPVASALARSGS